MIMWRCILELTAEDSACSLHVKQGAVRAAPVSLEIRKGLVLVLCLASTLSSRLMGPVYHNHCWGDPPAMPSTYFHGHLISQTGRRLTAAGIAHPTQALPSDIATTHVRRSIHQTEQGGQGGTWVPPPP